MTNTKKIDSLLMLPSAQKFPILSTFNDKAVGLSKENREKFSELTPYIDVLKSKGVQYFIVYVPESHDIIKENLRDLCENLKNKYNDDDNLSYYLSYNQRSFRTEAFNVLPIPKMFQKDENTEDILIIKDSQTKINDFIESVNDETNFGALPYLYTSIDIKEYSEFFLSSFVCLHEFLLKGTEETFAEYVMNNTSTLDQTYQNFVFERSTISTLLNSFYSFFVYNSFYTHNIFNHDANITDLKLIIQSLLDKKRSTILSSFQNFLKITGETNFSLRKSHVFFKFITDYYGENHNNNDYHNEVFAIPKNAHKDYFMKIFIRSFDHYEEDFTEEQKEKISHILKLNINFLFRHNQQTNVDLVRYFLEPYAEHFSPIEWMGITTLLRNPKNIIRNCSSGLVMVFELFMEFQEKKGNIKLLLETLYNIAASYDGAVPTLVEWKKAADLDDDFFTDIPISMFFAMVISAKRCNDRRMIQKPLRDYRANFVEKL